MGSSVLPPPPLPAPGPPPGSDPQPYVQLPCVFHNPTASLHPDLSQFMLSCVCTPLPFFTESCLTHVHNPRALQAAI